MDFRFNLMFWGQSGLFIYHIRILNTLNLNLFYKFFS